MPPQPSDFPSVLFIKDLARILRCSPTTIKRRMRTGDFPFPALPRVDKRHRWNGAVVKEHLGRSQVGRPTRLRGRKRRQ